jgi:hypothetical protein
MKDINGFLGWSSTVFIGFLLVGCCEEYWHEAREPYLAMTRFPVTHYTDSAGSTISIVMFDNEPYRYEDSYHQCSSSPGYSNIPQAQFRISEPEGATMEYSQVYETVNFWNVIEQPFGAALASSRVDTTIQGRFYANCWLAGQQDSLGYVNTVIVHPHYGLVLFNFRDRLHWERVPD